MKYDINEIAEPHILDYVDKKFDGKAVLAGRRALALAGITFNRPISLENDYDFCIKNLPLSKRWFNGLIKAGGVDDDGYEKIDNEKVKDIDHYYFKWPEKDAVTAFLRNTKHCLFVVPDLEIVEVQGIKIANPEQILYYKKQYIESSAKHRRDFENMSALRYKLNKL